MTQIAFCIKTFLLRNRSRTHLWMKRRALFAQVTPLVGSGSVFHQFSAPFRVGELTFSATNTMTTLIVLIVTADLLPPSNTRFVITCIFVVVG